MYSHLPWAHFLPVGSSEDCQRCYVSQIGEQALLLWVSNEAYLINEYVKIGHDDQVVTQVHHRRQSNYYTFFIKGNYFLRRSCLQKQTAWARIGHTIITAIALNFLTFWIPCGVDFFAFFLSLTGFPATTFVVIRHLSKRWVNYKKGNNSLNKNSQSQTPL